MRERERERERERTDRQTERQTWGRGYAFINTSNPRVPDRFHLKKKKKRKRKEHSAPRNTKAINVGRH